MRYRLVDERLPQWECDSPTYWVCFQVAGDPSGQIRAYELTDCDVLAAIDFAQRKAGPDDLFAVALLGEHGPLGEHAPGLTWLIGNDISYLFPGDTRLKDAFNRMVARKNDPVGIPAADRASL